MHPFRADHSGFFVVLSAFVVALAAAVAVVALVAVLCLWSA